MIKNSILLVVAGKNFSEDEYQVVKTVLERENFKIFIASDAHSLCVGNRGLKVRAEVSFFNMRENNFNALVIIGGSGIKDYWDNQSLQNLAVSFNNSNKIVSAICSAPVIFAKAGLLDGKEATCYQNDKNELERCGSTYIDKPVVFRKNIITAQDVSSSHEFAQTIAERLK